MTLATLLTTAFAAANTLKTDQGRLDRDFSHERDNFYGFFVQNMLFILSNEKIGVLSLLAAKITVVRGESVVGPAAVFPMVCSIAVQSTAAALVAADCAGGHQGSHQLSGGGSS